MSGAPRHQPRDTLPRTTLSLAAESWSGGNQACNQLTAHASLGPMPGLRWGANPFLQVRAANGTEIFFPFP